MAYEICLEKAQPLLISQEQFVQHQCKLAAKESGLKCACVKKDDFTVIIGGQGAIDAIE